MSHIIQADIVKVYQAPDTSSGVIATLFWGDEVLDVVPQGPFTWIRLGKGREGYVKGDLKRRADRILKVFFVDVGQGDACLVETPDEKRILIDGGEEKFLARYVAAKFAHINGPIHFDAIVITHGDADHYLGLPILVNAENHPTKKVYVTAAHIYHNGLVKRGGESLPRHKFGKTVNTPNGPLICDLVEDPRFVPEHQRTKSLAQWIQALDTLQTRGGGKLDVRRLDHSSINPFYFLDGQIRIEVLAPVLRRAGHHEGLPFLRDDRGSISAGHTANGHSIVLRLVHGDIRFLFTGDLNEQAEEAMLQHPGGASRLVAEVLKVPHHGSADFGDAFLRTVSPIVSVVSTGATNGRKDYLHPRANLLAALGASARPPIDDEHAAQPIVFVTKMAGALRYMGLSAALKTKKDGTQIKDKSGAAVLATNVEPFYALERDSYGIVHVRSDGRRFLVVRHGSGTGKKEAYAYRSIGGSRFVADIVHKA